MSVIYSPLCDSDPVLYRDYLATCHHVGSGVLVRREGVFGSNVGRVAVGGAPLRLSFGLSDAASVCLCGQSDLDDGGNGAVVDGPVDFPGRVGSTGGEVAVGDASESRGSVGDGVESAYESCDGKVECGVGRASCPRGPGGVSGASVLAQSGQGEKKIGKWKKKNQKKKENKRVRVQNEDWRRTTQAAAVVPAPVVVAEKSEARRTLEAKWVVENKLAKLRAEQELEIAAKRDVAEVARLRERKVKAAGERAMVQIERSHATLAATGNVPGVVPKGGYCTTVVDDPGLSDGSSPSCTISPDSSASMQEFRELQKHSLDLENEVAGLKKLLSRREKAGRMNREDSVAEFTANGSEVGLPASLCEVLDKKCGEYEYEGLCDGKHIVRAVRDLHFGFEEGEDVIGAIDVY